MAAKFVKDRQAQRFLTSDVMQHVIQLSEPSVVVLPSRSALHIATRVGGS